MGRPRRKNLERWRDRFSVIRNAVLEKMAREDDAVYTYASPSLQLVASPRIVCDHCLAEYTGTECPKACDRCGVHVAWLREPSWFPCTWGKMYAVPHRDQKWFLENRDAVAGLGFFVFKSDVFGVVLGIDTGPEYDEAYWLPLFKLRWLR
jgi:hypothetical protein